MVFEFNFFEPFDTSNLTLTIYLPTNIQVIGIMKV